MRALLSVSEDIMRISGIVISIDSLTSSAIKNEISGKLNPILDPTDVLQSSSISDSLTEVYCCCKNELINYLIC